MRNGFTTGSCAAAAAKAATYMLLTGNRKEKIEIETPKGLLFAADICDIRIFEDKVSCAVVKDGGDDPDVTTGARVYAEVTSFDALELTVEIDGGIGVGRVTKPGLDQPVGNAAINSVPRQMIAKEVKEVCQLLDYSGGIRVVISIPKGVELAKQTFNPRLGIEGGISVLGTSGVVEPMSEQALLDTIYVELKQKKALGQAKICITPGNYGLEFMKSTYDFDLDKAVKCSNFLGDTMEMIGNIGFREVLVVGHLGKLVKASGGMRNTHSKEGDNRMETLAHAAALCGADASVTEKVYACVTTEEAYRILREAGIGNQSMQIIVDDLYRHLREWAKCDIPVECMIYTKEEGLLGMTPGAEQLLREIKEYRL